nr:protein argonaute 2-like [Tanacetum cinerariifolium]
MNEYSRIWRRNLGIMELDKLRMSEKLGTTTEILGTEASRKLKEVSLLSPDVQRSEISRMVHDEYAICYRGHSAKVLESFKVEVGINMTEVIGRVMEPPYFEMGDNSILSGFCDWEMFSREPVFMGMTAKRWALINCSWASGKNKLNVEAFIQELRDCGTGMEVQMENPLVVRETCMSELSNLSKVRALLSSVIKESSKIVEEPLQLVFCVMADRGIGYGYLKWVSEAEIGVLTQCCLSENASKAGSQFLANLCLKINVELGGINVKLHNPFPHFSDDDSFMFIGADVSHPDELKRLSYSSVAALIGSVDPPSATRYTLLVHLGATGTSKLTHCSVIWDENGFSSDEMQKLIYHLSYLFARCSKPVSLVPPVYYTHLAAYRGQMLREVAWQAQSSSMSVKVADCLKDSMFFI